MNQTFSFQRWWLLVARHGAENRRRYLLSILAFMSLIVVWFVFVLLTDDTRPLAVGLQEITYFFSLFAVGPFYASQFFNHLGSKSKAVNYLMVPASNLEKTICGIFYAVVLFPIVFTLAFYLVDVVLVSLLNLLHPSYNTISERGVIAKEHVLNIFKTKEVPHPAANYATFMVFFLLQSAFLLGSVYFAQYSYIKTAIGLSLVCLFFAFVSIYIPQQMMPRGIFLRSLIQYRILIDDSGYKLVALPEWIDKTLNYLFGYGFFLVFWITTYFRVKEKEV